MEFKLKLIKAHLNSREIDSFLADMEVMPMKCNFIMKTKTQVVTLR